MLLSDLLLYPVYHLLNLRTDLFCTSSSVPNIAKWLHSVQASGAGEALDSILCQGPLFEKEHWSNLPLPEVAQHSLYKSDPARDGGKGYTRQTDVSRALRWWDESGLESLQEGEVASSQPLDWDSFPPLVLRRPGWRAEPPLLSPSRWHSGSRLGWPGHWQSHSGCSARNHSL